MMLKWQVANVFTVCVIHFDRRTQILTFSTHIFALCHGQKGVGARHIFPCRVYATATDNQSFLKQKGQFF